MAQIFRQLNFPLCLAPMVGLSHVALRRLVLSYLPEGALTLWPTEMLNSRRLPQEKIGFTPETKKMPEEKFLIPQILGNQEKEIRESVKCLEGWGADGIDINMGCPVQKALRHNYGVALMGDSDYAARVVEMTVRNTSLPVSVKLRAAGPEQDPEYFFKFAYGLQEAGASWLTLHPRTGEQKRRGSADWSQIRSLKKFIKLPLIGNGDVQTCEDVFRMKEETGCDLVMSGRALAARPWMMWQVGERLGLRPPVGRLGLAPQGPSEEAQEYGRAVLAYIDFCEADFSPNLGLRKVLFYIKTTHVWLDFGHRLYALATGCDSFHQLRVKVGSFFLQDLKMHARTDLRQ